MLEQIIDQIQSGTTVITGNQRLARWLQYYYSRHQVRLGVNVWESARIFAWPVWLRRSWNQLGISAVYLNRMQAEFVWGSVIEASTVARSLLNTNGAARLAQEAWQQQYQWRLGLDKYPGWMSEDSRAYASWSRDYHQECQKLGWVDDEIALGQLIESIKAGGKLEDRDICLAGFDEMTPVQAELFDSLRNAGIEVGEAKNNKSCQHAYYLGLTDSKKEYQAAARWARSRLEQNPEARIGIIVPDLAAERDTIFCELRDVLDPETVLSPGHHLHQCFNFSLGQPLVEQAIVSDAINSLKCLLARPNIEELGTLLRSPYIAFEKREVQDRHLLDQMLRRTGDFNPGIWSLIRLIKHIQIEHDHEEFCATLLRALESATELASKIGRARTIGQWMQVVDNMLQHLGWSTSGELDSADMQSLRAWKEAMESFMALEVVSGSIQTSDMLSRLTRVLRGKPFQPATAEAPVQVLGMLEASGLEFDFLWITGLHDQAWPASPRPNPYLPVQLQREHHLPHASDEREHLYARNVMQRLMQSTGELVASFPQQSGDEVLKPSPLITGLKHIQVSDLALPHYPEYRELIHRSQNMEKLDDPKGPALASEKVAGGSRLFELQASCPFRAFSELRLNSRSLDEVSIGLDAASRGTLVHRVLERCWQEIRGSRSLQAMGDAEVGRLVQQFVNEVVDDMAQEKPGTFTKQFTEIEKDRLQKLVGEWLAYEKTRDSFKVVEREKNITITIGDVTVNAIVDRIDELEDGERVLIDYKTGRISPAGWSEDRLEQPQLPLYSQSIDNELAGLAIAQVRKGEMALKGVVKNKSSTKGLKTADKLCGFEITWDELRARWHTSLKELASEYSQGYAVALPKSYPDTCRYCELTAFCRISDYSVNSLVEDEGEV